ASAGAARSHASITSSLSSGPQEKMRYLRRRTPPGLNTSATRSSASPFQKSGRWCRALAEVDEVWPITLVFVSEEASPHCFEVLATGPRSLRLQGLDHGLGDVGGYHSPAVPRSSQGEFASTRA